MNVVEVAAGELRNHPRRHRRDERQSLDTLHKGVEEAGRMALVAVGQAAQILPRDGGPFADRTPPGGGRVGLRQFQFHITAKLHDPRRAGGPVDRLPPLRFRHRFPKIGIESVAVVAREVFANVVADRQRCLLQEQPRRALAHQLHQHLLQFQVVQFVEQFKRQNLLPDQVRQVGAGAVGASWIRFLQFESRCRWA